MANGDGVLDEIRGGSAVIDFVEQEIKEDNAKANKIDILNLILPCMATSFLFLLSSIYFFKLSNPSINLLNAPSGSGRAKALPQFVEVR
jgi:hypothetical protein